MRMIGMEYSARNCWAKNRDVSHSALSRFDMIEFTV